MKNLCLLSIAVLFFSSCFVSKDLKKKAKAERLIERAIALDPSISSTKTDTVEYTYVYIDTIFVPGGQIDSTFNLASSDTIFITDSSTGVIAEIVYLSVDTSGLFARIKATITVPEKLIPIFDTLYIKVPVTYDQIKNTRFHRAKLSALRALRSFWFIFIIAGVAIIGGITYIKMKKFMP